MTGLTVDEKIGVPVTVFIALLVAFLFLTPSSLWFKVNHFDVGSAPTWEGVEIEFDRTISRNFDGEWQVAIRREVEGGWESVCTTAWQPQEYRKNAVLPEPVTLEWLAYVEPQCYELAEGTYEVTVTWEINPNTPFMRREVQVVDTFTITGVS